MEIVTVDPYDEPALRSWYEAYHGGAVADRQSPTVWTLPELTVVLRRSYEYRTEAYAALDGDRVVGGASAMMPLLDNPRLLEFEINVPPAERRRGVGTALFAHVLDVARAEGRTSLLVEVVEPYQGTGPVEGRPFAERRGFRCVNREVHRTLDLPPDPAVWDALDRHAAERRGGYRLRTWSGACPDDLAAGYVTLRARFIGEVPLGDMDYEPERWDEDRLRSEERKDVDQRRTTYTTVAVAPDGELVGHTVLKVPGHDPGVVFQADTLVLPEHRGHRLGLALKAGNLRTMLAGQPDRRTVHTWNASDNGPMVAVNEAMGFQPVEQMGEYQRSL
ncbi:MAG: GNAT family N-acetyltransferase [Micromonosporaceae bacterium]